MCLKDTIFARYIQRTVFIPVWKKNSERCVWLWRHVLTLVSYAISCVWARQFLQDSKCTESWLHPALTFIPSALGHTLRVGWFTVLQMWQKQYLWLIDSKIAMHHISLMAKHWVYDKAVGHGARHNWIPLAARKVDNSLSYQVILQNFIFITINVMTCFQID